MKINGFEPEKISASAKPKTGGKASEIGAPALPAAEESAVAKLSGTTTELKAEAPFDAAKVARIIDAIKTGQLQPKPEAIADGLIANYEKLLGE